MESNGSVEKTFVPSAGWFPLVLVLAGVIVTPLLFVMVNSHDHEPSLRSNTQEISDQLRTDIQDRLNKAGVEVIEARISHLAYAPEIAAAMLQRQQASAVVAARTKIVEGAVGMVQLALDHLNRDKIVELDDERKAAMVCNLLVVLCSDRHAQPVVNTGTLHH